MRIGGSCGAHFAPTHPAVGFNFIGVGMRFGCGSGDKDGAEFVFYDAVERWGGVAILWHQTDWCSSCESELKIETAGNGGFERFAREGVTTAGARPYHRPNLFSVRALRNKYLPGIIEHKHRKGQMDLGMCVVGGEFGPGFARGGSVLGGKNDDVGIVWRGVHATSMPGQRQCYNQSMSGTSKHPEHQFPGQHDGEEVQLVFHQHPLVMRKTLVIGLLVIVVAVLPLDFPQVYANDAVAAFFLNALWVVLAGVFFAWFYRWVGWYYTVYIVTDRRILEIRQKGFFDRRVEEWQLDGISNVNYHIGGFQAVLFGYGDITARTYIGDLEMKTIHKPADIHAALVGAVRRAGGGGSTQPGN